MFVAEKLDDLQSDSRFGNESLSEDLNIMSETSVNDISSVYFIENLNSHAPHQAFCGNLLKIVIPYEFVCKRLSTLDVEASMGPDGFHTKLLSSC